VLPDDVDEAVERYGSVSEHEEGRALDYMLDANNAADRAVANDFLGWLLATDQYGNQHAMARRLGVMYIIWNRQIWGAYRASEGWRTYSCDGTPGSCHTNHIHISFSWAGALRQTTWWTQAGDSSMSDVDNNRAADLVLTTDEPSGGSAGWVLLSTWQSFLSPAKWWNGSVYGWSGVTPLVRDVNGDRRADFVYLTNEGANGTKAFVALSTGSGWIAPQLWWNGTGWGYSGIKGYLS